MSKALLSQFIKMVIAEVAGAANVPDQLVDTDEQGTKTQDNDEVEQDMDEMSGCGSICGYVGPLGMDPDKLGRKKNKQH